MFFNTPGPWRLQDNRHCSTNSWVITVRKPGVNRVTVANIPHKATIDEDEAMHNARLIAHSPEMVELLMRFVAWYSNKKPDNFNMVMPFENQPPEIQDAMKLIKRATGLDYVNYGEPL